jgi:hypothetical protein
MKTCTQPTAARSPRLLFGLAAAATALTARSAAAGKTMPEPASIQTDPRTPHVQSSYQTAVGLTAQGPIRDPLLVAVELSGGFYEDMHPSSLTASPGLGLKLPHGFSIFAGYYYSAFWGTEHERGEEQAAFQQVAYQAPFTEVILSGRVRTEERFQPGSDVGYRLRTQVQLNVPLWHGAPVQAVLWDEVFLALNQPGPMQPALMDLDLFFAGIGWSIDSHFRVEVGYQGALVPRPDVTALVHCLSIGTTVSW